MQFARIVIFSPHRSAGVLVRLQVTGSSRIEARERQDPLSDLMCEVVYTHRSSVIYLCIVV